MKRKITDSAIFVISLRKFLFNSYVTVLSICFISATAGAPSQPRVDKVTPKSVTLSWDKPANAGGGKIQGYIVEVKPKGGDWSDASPYPIKENEFTVPNLKEGEEYQFRVKAVNEAGPGTPSAATGPVVAEKPAG